MKLAELKWPEVEKLSRDTPIVFPIAALEQHGRHLPLFTDSMQLEEVVRRAESRLGDRVVFAPVLWLGNSDHHLDFPGTLSAPPRTYLDILKGLADNFIRHGFKRLVFLNGHGGNNTPGRQALFEVRQFYRDRTDLLLLMATYWELADAGRLAKIGQTQPAVLHACEFETSMVLRLAPRLVGKIAAAEPVENAAPFAPASRAWTTKDRSADGHIGDPRTATPEKGEALFEIFAESVVELMERTLAWDGRS